MVKIRDIIKTDDIIRVSPNDSLSSALSKLQSSHDAAFTFSDDNQFMGIINPYYSLIKSSFPGNAKVEHCLYHPPKIRMNYSFEKVMKFFVETRVHYLPVFDEHNDFKGIISARKLLKVYQDSPRLLVPISDLLSMKSKQPVLVYEDETISVALHLFKLYKKSKLIVVNRDNKLKGVLSYYDLIYYLIAPKDKEHQIDSEGTKNSLFHQRVKRFAKSYVLTLTPSDSVRQAVDLILQKHIGSVMVVDQNKRPLGIITTRDLFKILLGPHRGFRFDVLRKNLSTQNSRIVNHFFRQMNNNLRNFPNLTGAHMTVKEEHQGGVFKVLLSLFPKKGENKVIEKQGKNLPVLLHEIKEGVKNDKARI